MGLKTDTGNDSGSIFNFGNRPGSQTGSTRSDSGSGWGGKKCWTCDETSYALCASNGNYVTCPDGDEDCCFVEIRKTDTELNSISTGCKDFRACQDLRAQNYISYFWDGEFSISDQCKPGDAQQLRRYGKGASPYADNALHHVTILL